MDKRKILIQLDGDAQPSVFDRVVAVDAGADEVFSYGGVRPEQVRDLVHGAIFTRGPKDLPRALEGRTLVVAAGAAGVVLLPASARSACPGLKMVIDLNAVPPLGVEGVQPTDKGVERDGALGYGALGVGDTKMKLHKAA